MKYKTEDARDRLKMTIADHEIRLFKIRLRIRKGDAAALKTLNRLEDTLALYKLTFETIERSAELLTKSSVLSGSRQ